MRTREVVVTGIGILTPLGTNINDTWQGLLAGKNGIVKLEDFNKDLTNYGINVVAPLPNFDLSSFNIHKKLLRKMNYVTQMMVWTGLRALEDAHLSYPEDTMKYEVGAVVGTGTAMAAKYFHIDLEERPPTWFLETFPNITLSYLAKIASLKGYGTTVVNACSSGNQALGHAFHIIRSGLSDVLVAGAVEDKMYSPFFSGFSRLNMTTPSSDPDSASRPFDRDRNGFVLGKGACILVLESLEHAIKRNVKPLASIIGYGAALDCDSLTDASKDGIIRAMKMALVDARLTNEKIDYINAHGTSTVSNDNAESIAIKELFRERAYEIPINSTKSMIGHTFSASSAIEAAVCIKSLQDQKVHLTRNFENPTDICDLDYVKGESRDVKIEHCLSVSSGIGGYNSTLIFKKI